MYTFILFASGYGALQPPLGTGTLEEGLALVHKLEAEYERWVAEGAPDTDTGLHTHWEGCDIAATSEGGRNLYYYSQDDDGHKEGWTD